MPKRPKKPCSGIRCPNLAEGQYCEEHKDQAVVKQKEYDKQRGSSAQRGYDSRWQKARKMFLKRNPLCVHCEEEGRLTPANEVDHVIPHKGDMKLFWDADNWQALCKPCHSSKTATEDGGFGR